MSANSFGLGGTNGHILLKANTKNKVATVSDGVPRLVCVSGRTEAAVERMLDKVWKNTLCFLMFQLRKLKLEPIFKLKFEFFR